MKRSRRGTVCRNSSRSVISSAVRRKRHGKNRLPGQSDAETGKSLKYKRDFCKEAKPEPGSGLSSAARGNRNSVPVYLRQLAGTGTRFRFCLRQLPGTGTRFRYVFGVSREPELGSGMSSASPGNRNSVPVCLRRHPRTGTRFRFIFGSLWEPEPGSGLFLAARGNRNSVPVF